MKAIWIGLALWLAGCAGLQSTDPASPYYAYTAGWTVQLNRPLTIEPGAATVRLQYGRIARRNSVQEQDPFCMVELEYGARRAADAAAGALRGMAGDAQRQSYRRRG